VSSIKVRYDYGFNNSGTGQHEVLEYVTRTVHGAANGHANCRCVSKGVEIVEGPYVVLFTEQKCTAECIAMLLNADGTDNNFPATPMTAGITYMNKRFAKQAQSSPPPPRSNDPQLGRETWKHEYGMTGPGDCPPGDLGNEVR
jgi:hypothetical protein